MSGKPARSRRYRVLVGVTGGLAVLALALFIFTLFTGPNFLIVSHALVFVFVLGIFLLTRRSTNL